MHDASETRVICVGDSIAACDDYAATETQMVSAGVVLGPLPVSKGLRKCMEIDT